MNNKFYRIILTGFLWLIIFLFVKDITVEAIATVIWLVYIFVFNEEA